MTTAAVYLFVWAITTTAGTQYSVWEQKDWVNKGEFTSAVTCAAAARELNYNHKQFKCVPK